MVAPVIALSSAFARTNEAEQAIALLQSGGDARIVLDPATGLNRYMSAPYPRDVLAFASSTANDMSPEAFAHILEGSGPAESGGLGRFELLRARIRTAYGLRHDTDVVFAPSGTDLEYVALAAASGRAPGGLHNVLLGADEVGSGCIHSAHGRYFAGETALGHRVKAGEAVAGFPPVSLADVAVRSRGGEALSSVEVARLVGLEIELARTNERHAIVHVVHGSKTGLILPEFSELDDLRQRFGNRFSIVVDACQARITSEAVQDYLARDAIVFVTGSKFMGGPPFSGFALVPSGMGRDAAPLAAGLATVFRRPEWPLAWTGPNHLPDGENAGLLLRLEASIFELERFQALAPAAVARVTAAFQRGLRQGLLEPCGFSLVQPYPQGAEHEAREHPVEMLTLATIDVSTLSACHTFEQAVTLHRRMALSGTRLGQPVKCVRLPGGGWGGTLRVGLSMPQVVRWAALDDDGLERAIGGELARVADAVRECAHAGSTA